MWEEGVRVSQNSRIVDVLSKLEGWMEVDQINQREEQI